MNVKDKIIEVSKGLDELENYNEELSEMISTSDKKLSDLYHFLELMTLDSKKCYRFCKELKDVLLERRKQKRDKSLLMNFEQQKQKLINGKSNRDLLLNSVFRVDKGWENKYKNDIYTEEELIEKIGE